MKVCDLGFLSFFFFFCLWWVSCIRVVDRSDFWELKPEASCSLCLLFLTLVGNINLVLFYFAVPDGSLYTVYCAQVLQVLFLTFMSTLCSVMTPFATLDPRLMKLQPPNIYSEAQYFIYWCILGVISWCNVSSFLLGWLLQGLKNFSIEQGKLLGIEMVLVSICCLWWLLLKQWESLWIRVKDILVLKQ